MAAPSFTNETRYEARLPVSLNTLIGKLERLLGKYPDFDLLHGIEVDVNPDGSLPVDDGDLGFFDFVIAAFPENGGYDRDQLLERAIQAAKHPQVTILGNPVGDFMLRGCNGDSALMEKVLTAAAESGIGRQHLHRRADQHAVVELLLLPELGQDPCQHDQRAAREVAPNDVEEYVVVRVADEVVVDLMKSACGIDYAEAQRGYESARQRFRQAGDELQEAMTQTRSKQIRKKLAKRIKLLQGLQLSQTRPEWMILTVLPVIPPDLRPLVPLEVVLRFDPESALPLGGRLDLVRQMEESLAAVPQVGGTMSAADYADLIGAPLRLVVSPKTLAEDKVETLFRQAEANARFAAFDPASYPM